MPDNRLLNLTLAQDASARVDRQNRLLAEPVQEVSASSWSPFSIGRKLVEGIYSNPETVAEAGLSLAPGSGEAMSARDAWDASGRGYNALLEGNYGDAAGQYANMLTGAIGSIPIAGVAARSTKRGAAWMDRNVPVAVNRLLDAAMPSAAPTQAVGGGPRIPRSDSEVLVYHGTPSGGFQKFDPEQSSDGVFYWTDNPDVASAYANSHLDNGGETVYPAFIDTNRFRKVDFKGERWTDTLAEKFASKAKTARLLGFKGIVGKNIEDVGGLQDQYATWKPGLIRSSITDDLLY